MHLRAALASLTLLAACDSTPTPSPTPPSPAPAASGTQPSSTQPSSTQPSSTLPTTPTKSPPLDVSVPTRFEAAERVVAIGDVHGDISATRKALKAAGLIDGDDHWTGGEAVLVQTGDVLDRGDDEQAIIELLLNLQEEAKAAGGVVHLLQGNHELMNAAGDFRYVTAGGFRDFTDVPGLDMSRPILKRLPEEQRPRAAAFLPGGVYAKKIATHPVAIVVGDTVFTHGGVLPKHVKYGLEKMNREVAAWLLGGPPGGMSVVRTTDSVVWSRHYSDEPDESDCKTLAEALTAAKAKRMVVGHTVQPTIRPACDEKVWRVDVGMAAHYGGEPEALEITKDGVRALRAD